MCKRVGRGMCERIARRRELAVVTRVLDHLNAQPHTHVLKIHVKTLLWTRSSTCSILGPQSIKPIITPYPTKNKVRITVWMSIRNYMHISVLILIIGFLRSNILCPTRSDIDRPYLRGLEKLDGFCDFDFNVDATFYPELSSRCAVFECRPVDG